MHRSLRSTDVVPFTTIDRLDLESFVDRLGPNRVVLLGDMTTGTTEGVALRSHITRHLIEHAGFDVVALETDWPDAAHMDRHIKNDVAPDQTWTRYVHWPDWQWRNQAFATFISQLRALNQHRDDEEQVRLCGLDIYGSGAAIHAVLRFLDEHDPKAAAIARERYDCLVRWEDGPTGFGQSLPAMPTDCQQQVLSVLTDLLERRLDAQRPDDALFDARQNAHLIRNAEAFYRSIYHGHMSTWNLRSTHMAETLQAVLKRRGPDSKAVVWAHNVHVGDTLGLPGIARKETSLGNLCRAAYDGRTYSVGLFNGAGTVRASAAYQGPGAPVNLLPPRPDSHGAYLDSLGPARFLAPLQDPDGRPEQIDEKRLERSVGPVYRPHRERRSHYFESVLPDRFDEVAWLGRAHAVEPVGVGGDGFR